MKTIKECLTEAAEAYIDVLIGERKFVPDEEASIAAITRLASTLYIQAARTGGHGPAPKEDRRVTATGKQIPYFESLMNAATDEQIADIRLTLTVMGYEDIPNPKDILMDDMSVLINKLLGEGGKE